MFQFLCENGQFLKGLTYGNEPFSHENCKFKIRLVFDMHVGNNLKAKFHHNDPLK